MSSTFKMQIITPEKTAFDGDIQSITVQTGEGYIELMARHESILLKTLPTIAKVILGDGTKAEYFISGGIAKFEGNELKLCVGALETKEDIDLGRAKEAKDRAEKRLKESNWNEKRAHAALQRSILRIRLKEQ
ncbi:MAG: ATP synthase delta/epsilon chain alpha-helix domain-containing protein [Clostridium chrysemydis]|uniref:ATP synthase delta/epsilon chain alpha-helix domain-containing protein n=1 Tax=Clostridium chrysemydis TaxID=2665504 RepID=UPI003F4076AF